MHPSPTNPDAQQRQKRKEAGGNGSKQFCEGIDFTCSATNEFCNFIKFLYFSGWIEFADKKVAKKVAESLNNTAIGGKKGDFYHDDIWNLKYLKNFK